MFEQEYHDAPPDNVNEESYPLYQQNMLTNYAPDHRRTNLSYFETRGDSLFLHASAPDKMAASRHGSPLPGLSLSQGPATAEPS